MRRITLLFLGLVFFLASCESWFQEIGLKDIQRFDGPCTILLKDGTVIETPHSLEVTIRTEAITYRDEDGKLWSLFREEYESYSCN